MYAMQGIDTVAMADRIGVSVRRLGHWDRLGIASPSILPARGSGTRRLYAEGDLVYLLLVKAVRDLGGTLDLADRIVSAVRLAGRDAGGVAGLRLVADSKSVAFCGTDKIAFQAALEHGGAVLVLNLDWFVVTAQRLARRPSQPTVEVAELGGAATQVTIVPSEQAFTASAKKFPGLKASARSVSEAIDALRRAIDLGPKEDFAEEPSKQAAPPQKSGASAWGGEW